MHVSDLTEDRALDLLDALAGHSLVNVDATDAGPRFRMLASVRELAAERLAAGADQADVERRHAEYFGALVENADWPAERQAEWAERLRTEEENLRVAIRWFLTHDISPLPHIFRILWLFWQMRGRMPEGRAWIDEVQRRADALDDRAQAELLFTSAVTAVEVGDDDSALAAVEGLDDSKGASTTRISRAPPSWQSRGSCRSSTTSTARCRPRRQRSTASASRTSRSWRLPR